MKDVEIAEKFVDWAAGKRMTAANVWRTLNSWPALKMTENEREYIKVLAERKCPAVGWTKEFSTKHSWFSKKMKP